VLPRNLLSQIAGQQLQIDPATLRTGLFDRMAGQAAVENPGLVERIAKNIDSEDPLQSV
jgi:hypothetical protein